MYGKQIYGKSFLATLFFVLGIHIAVQTRAAFGYEILTIGDSITRGTIYVTGDGNGRQVGPYQAYLEEYLANKGLISNVYNWGISGETTYGGLSRINTVLSSRAADYILIMEGANDLYEGISPATTTANLKAMITRAKAKNVTPVLGNITPNAKTSGFDSLVSGSYNPSISIMAGQNSTWLADQYEALRPDWTSVPLNHDGLHPNLLGYQIMAQTWLDTLLAANAAIVPVLHLLLGQ